MNQDQNPKDFIEQAGDERTGFIREFYDFLRHNKKWWLIPVVFVVLTLGLLVVLGGSEAASFIYTLF